MARLYVISNIFLKLNTLLAKLFCRIAQKRYIYKRTISFFLSFDLSLPYLTNALIRSDHTILIRLAIKNHAYRCNKEGVNTKHNLKVRVCSRFVLQNYIAIWSLTHPKKCKGRAATLTPLFYN